MSAEDATPAQGRWWTRLERALCHASSTQLLLGVATLLVVPTLTMGLVVDDYFHKMVLAGVPGHSAPMPSPWMHLFSFLPKDPPPGSSLLGLELYPWWTDPQVQITFWRPLTAMTHWLDYKLWPEWPVLMHAHNIAWFLALCGVVIALYRRLLPGAWWAGLAAFLYIVNDAFAFPVGWIANRNGLIAAFFGLLALLCHHRWRGEGWRWGLPAGVACFALGLLSAEAGLGVCAFLFAYALCLDKGVWWRGLLYIVPYALVAVVWRLGYKAMGYGAFASGFYTDPLHSPAAFGRALVEYMPLLLLGEWGAPSPAFYLTIPATGQLIWWLWAVVFLALLGVALWPLRREPLVRFGLLGMFLALIPACATKPHERLALFANLGAMLVLARLFLLWARRDVSLPQSPMWRRLTKVMVVFMVWAHFVGSPLMLLAKGQGMRLPDSWMQTVADDLKVKPGAADEPIVLLNSISVFFDLNAVLRRMMQGKVAPKQVWSLSPATYGVTVKALDAHSISVRPKRGYLQEFDTLYRDPARRFQVGQVIQRKGYTATVRSLRPDGRPDEVHFRFALPLRSPKLHFYKGTSAGYRPWKVPPLGQSVWLPPVRW